MVCKGRNWIDSWIQLFRASDESHWLNIDVLDYDEAIGSNGPFLCIRVEREREREAWNFVGNGVIR